MKYTVIATVLALAMTSPLALHARSAAIDGEQPAPPAPPLGIPVQSPTLRAELIEMHRVLLQMYASQVETNRLLTTMAPAPPAPPTTHAP
jgi:hypothetical protein